MSHFCREGGLRVECGQMTGTCFSFYVRFPGGWNGTRAIYHMHDGACRADCAANCDGYNGTAAALVLLLAEWSKTARAIIHPCIKARNLDEVVAEIAKGLHGKPRRKAKKAGAR